MAQSGSKGTKSNPYTMSEYESMADAGTWQGGYVIDDSGTVTYIMKEVTVSGYSCGSYKSGSGSWDFQFASYTSFSGDPSLNDDDDDDGYGNGGIGGGTSGSGGGTGGSGGGSNYNPNNNVNNGKQGTFLYGAQFYTENEYLQMQQDGTWHGGNVYTLGYIGSDHVISSGLSFIDSNDNWLQLLGEDAINVRSWMNSLDSGIMSLAYVQAVGRYNSATGKPLTFDVNKLGLSILDKNDLDPIDGDSTKFRVRTFSTNFFMKVLTNFDVSNSDKLQAISTALTLGEITFEKVSGNTYKILPDTYDFRMHDLKDSNDFEKIVLRNIETLLGHAVCETLSIGMDALTFDIWNLAFNPVVSRMIYIATGIVRRHVIGSTEFQIEFTGTITIE